MAKPCKGDWRKLKHLARYLIDHRKLVNKFAYQPMPGGLEVYTDTNHAGCIRTRKSTNGGLILHGGHMIKSWSSTQSVVALSSGESEYYGLVKGVSEALGIRSVLADWRQVKEINVWTDSSAAKGIAN